MRELSPSIKAAIDRKNHFDGWKRVSLSNFAAHEDWDEEDLRCCPICAALIQDDDMEAHEHFHKFGMPESTFPIDTRRIGRKI